MNAATNSLVDVVRNAKSRVNALYQIRTAREMLTRAQNASTPEEAAHFHGFAARAIETALSVRANRK